MDQFAREPCPFRIVDDLGGAFSMGLAGGGIFHGARELIKGPKGSRFLSASIVLRQRAPILGGQFALWGLGFSATDCTLIWLRGKEDYWNSIISGGIVGAVLTARQGPVPMAVSGAIGALILGAIEGVGAGINYMTAQMYSEPPADPSALGPEPSALGGMRPSTSAGGGIDSSPPPTFGTHSADETSGELRQEDIMGGFETLNKPQRNVVDGGGDSGGWFSGISLPWSTSANVA